MVDKFSIKFLSNNIRVSCYSMVLKFKVNLIVTKEIMALIRKEILNQKAKSIRPIMILYMMFSHI